MDSRIQIYVDASCDEVHQCAGVGIVFAGSDGARYMDVSRPIGYCRIEQAEAKAIMAAMIVARDLHIAEYTLHCDSQSTVARIGDTTDVVDSEFGYLCLAIRREVARAGATIHWFSREHNADADELAWAAANGWSHFGSPWRERIQQHERSPHTG